MLLYLVRHGVAVDSADPKCPPDPQRRLTEKGVTKAREVANGLKEVGAAPDLILSSPYLRALETAEIFAVALDYPKDRVRSTDALKSGASSSGIFRELARLRGQGEVMCFGHAPHLDEVIAAAVGAPVSFTALKKAGVACLDMGRLTPPRGALLWLATPKLLRAFGE